VPLAAVVTVAVGPRRWARRGACGPGGRPWPTAPPRLERERDSAAARAAVEERLRIARDLHDLVGHGLTGIAVQSSTARLAVEDGDLDQARAALQAVERSARDALAEVRQLLGVLRSEQGPAPAQGLADLPALVAEAQGRGADVRLDLRAGPVPAAVGLTAYRVVQEALTNAARHAPGAAVRVVVEDEAGGVRVRVEDCGASTVPASPGTGHGLIGMRERVHAAGGTVEAGPRRAGGWRVDVHLPREAGP
jgi:signal transduction histidine kinase